MNKRTWILIVGVSVFAAAGVLALEAVLPGDATPAQIVLTRKAAMQSFAANVGDLRAKSAANAVKQVAVNARSMAVIGTFLPSLFGDAYATDYPAGFKFFYKGGSGAEIRMKAQTLVSAAETLADLADKEDKPGVDAQIAVLQATCGACHGAYRGQN